MEQEPDLEAELGSLANRMITSLTGESSVVAFWALVADVRGEDASSTVGLLTPSGMPHWIRDALLREVGAGPEWQEEDWDDDEVE